MADDNALLNIDDVTELPKLQQSTSKIKTGPEEQQSEDAAAARPDRHAVQGRRPLFRT